MNRTFKSAICQSSTRWHFLATNAMGIASLALATLLHDEGLFAEESSQPEKPPSEPVVYDLKLKPLKKCMDSMIRRRKNMARAA